MDRLRQLGALHWGRFLALVVGIPTLINAIKPLVPNVHGWPAWVTQYGPIVVAGCLLLLIRFPRVANAITRFILPPAKSPPGGDKDRIFIGPRSYTSEDSERFFGRKREADDCWREMQRYAFFVLEGESGCGKSSLLNAAIIPKASGVFRVVACRIADDPFGKVRAALVGQPYRPSETAVSEAALTEALAAAPTRQRRGWGGDGIGEATAVVPGPV